MTANMVVLLTFSTLAIVTFFVLIFIILDKKRKLEKEKQRIIEETKKKNELKESIETGNDNADFDTSINILHNLSKK